MENTNSNKKLVVAGLLLAVFMSAIDNTVVATAMGSIVSDIGGLDKFAWVTATYIVGTMAAMPIFGKLSDMYGRKRFFVFGILMFLFGSVLCGFAHSMEQLSIYRAIQGIGGGALMPIATAIVYDIFPPEKRGKMVGLLGAVYGVASVVGPLLGAFITDSIGWAWIFFINVPIGIIAFVLTLKCYKESLSYTKQKVDWWGALTLVIAVISLMFALQLGGNQYAWNSTPIIVLFVSFAVFSIVFYFVERRVDDPILPFFLFKRRLFSTSQILAFLYGATFICLVVYIPIYVQAVYGSSATSAGLILTPMMLGTVAGSAIGGIFSTKTSYRNLMILSVIPYFIGMFLLGTLTPDSARFSLTIYMILVGFGMGFSFSLLPMSSQHNLEAHHRGTAISTNSFIRTFGMTLGILIFGAIQSKMFTKNLTESFKGMGDNAGAIMGNVGDVSRIFEPSVRAKVPNEILSKIIEAMSSSVAHIFLLSLIPVGIAVIVVFMMGNSRVSDLIKQENSKTRVDENQ